MALEQVVKCPVTQAKLSAGMQEIIEGFYRWLLENGFSQERVQSHILNISHFDAYLAKQRTLPLKIISSKDVDTFLSKYPLTLEARERGKTHIRYIRFSVNRFVEYLREEELFDPLPKLEIYQPLLDAYLEWIRTYQHAASETVEVRRHLLTQFLKWLGPKGANVQALSTLNSEEVERFFLKYAQRMGQSRRRLMQGTLRTFFRFCHHEGLIQRPLDHAVPALRTYKLSTLPRGLTEAQAQKILQCPDRCTDAGRRDYAILQLLYSYGARCGQVRALRLADINWAENQILFKASKHGKDSLLPLTVEVGESLLDYLHHARPHYPYSEIFLTSKAPYHPLCGCAISEMVSRHIQKAGIDIPYKGAHVFRHAFATRMLQNGNPLKSIADVLGHRHLQTTSIYTKVDSNALSQVALQWPQEVN